MNAPQDHELHHALITGVLGGLGSRIALRLLDRGIPVIGVDAFDPGAAPAVHQQYILKTLREHDAFTFHAIDIRSMVSVEPHLPGDHGPETAAFFQCAGMQPHRKTSLNSGVANDVMVHAASRLFNTAADLGVRSVIPVHWPLEDKDDPRAESDQWKAILDAEQMLAEQYQGSELHVFRRFATLTGNGQSPYQPPLRELWNVVARQPVYRPVDGRALGFALFDAAAELMVMTAHAEISQDFELEHDIGLGGEYLHPEALIKGLTKTVGLQPEWLDEPGGQPWGATPREEFEVEEEIATRERFMNAVLSWATELPHFPPADWPRQMRPSRKRRKRGGKG